MNVSLMEVLVVAAVGAGLAYVADKTVADKASPLVVGAGLYTLGYVIAANRESIVPKQLTQAY